MPLQLDDLANQLNKTPGIGRYLQQALTKIQSSVNTLGSTLAVDPNGTNNPKPDPIQNLTVKASNGFYHAVISDSNQIQKGLNYFVEYDTDPNFTQPHVVHLGASRQMSPVQLPSKADDGTTPTPWHFRGYSQYRGGDPGDPVNFGGKTPTPVSGGGSLSMTLIPSTGSGTAGNNGQQGGSGLGRFQQRQPA